MNPREPRAFAYRAVLAHLRSDSAGEEDARKKALERWDSNPEIDCLIGRKLSQKYRFSEGAARQKRALAMDPEYGPAKLQLCQDLLRWEMRLMAGRSLPKFLAKMATTSSPTT